MKTIAVIGGGSAGFTAAKTASDAGARVLLFLGPKPEKPSLCVNRGCMPSKALFAPIDALHHARRYAGIDAGPDHARADLARIVRWKDREIARFRAFRRSTIRHRAGTDFVVLPHPARFVDPHTLEAAGETYEVDAAIVATGSTTVEPPIRGLAEVRGEIWTNDEILDNTEPPDSLLVIGAGAMGLEFSIRYARLGVAVTVASATPALDGFPAAFGERIVEAYEREGVRMLPERRVATIRRDPDGWFVAEVEGEAFPEPVAAERVLLAAGRRPALDDLGLEAAGIERDEGGALAVGPDLRVEGHPHVFVAGDATGRRMVVHQAHIEAGIAAANAADDGDRTWTRKANLWVVFSDPEFAWAGAMPAETEGMDLVRASKESRLVGKLHLAGDDLGFGEFAADRETGRLVSAGLLCDDAAEMIHLPAFLIEHDRTVHEGAEAEYYHPTKIEIVGSILDRLCDALGVETVCRPPE